MLVCIIAAERNCTDSDPRKVHRKSAGFLIGDYKQQLQLFSVAQCFIAVEILNNWRFLT